MCSDRISINIFLKNRILEKLKKELKKFMNKIVEQGAQNPQKFCVFNEFQQHGALSPQKCSREIMFVCFVRR